MRCKVFPPTFPDQRENVRVAHVVAPHVCAFAILIGTCVRDIVKHMALVDATITVSYPHGLRNAYKQDYGTKDTFMRHFIFDVSRVKAFNAGVVNVNSQGCKKARTAERFVFKPMALPPGVSSHAIHHLRYNHCYFGDARCLVDATGA